MPLPRWLKSMLSRKPSPTGAPPFGEESGRSPATLASVEPSPDQSHRIHIAANDPAFAAKREAAVALICAAISDIATPLGYTRKGTTWARQTTRGKSAINLQRSRYGFTADLNLRFLTPDGEALTEGIWAQDDDIRLQHFYQPSDGISPQELTYIDVVETPGCLAYPMHILATRALPWLDAHHTATDLPELDAYLPR